MSRKASMTNEEMRAASLRAARQSFSGFGFYGSRVDVIASDAAVNKRMIYEFYSSKKGLYHAVLNSVVDEIQARLDEKLPKTGDWREDARALLRWYFTLYHESTDFVRLVMWESLTVSGEGSVILEASTKVTDRIAVLIDEGVKNGVFKEGISKQDLVLTSFMTQGYFASLVTRKEEVAKRWDIDLQDPAVYERVVELMVELFFQTCLR